MAFNKINELSPCIALHGFATRRQCAAGCKPALSGL